MVFSVDFCDHLPHSTRTIREDGTNESLKPRGSQHITMESRKALEYLEDLAEKLGIEIVYERLGEEEFSVRGDLCKVKGAYKIFMDRSKPVEDQIAILSRALSTFDTEGIYLLPYIREILEIARRSSE